MAAFRDDDERIIRENVGVASRNDRRIAADDAPHDAFIGQRDLAELFSDGIGIFRDLHLDDLDASLADGHNVGHFINECLLLDDRGHGGNRREDGYDRRNE